MTFLESNFLTWIALVFLTGIALVFLEEFWKQFNSPIFLNRDRGLMSWRGKEALWLYSTDKLMNRDVDWNIKSNRTPKTKLLNMLRSDFLSRVRRPSFEVEIRTERRSNRQRRRWYLWACVMSVAPTCHHAGSREWFEMFTSSRNHFVGELPRKPNIPFRIQDHSAFSDSWRIGPVT